jgi:amino acid adenylation domain-containing protein
MEVQDRQISGSLVYNRDLFEPETITRMLGHFQMILSEMTRRPDAPVSRLKILTDTEYAELAAAGNADPVSYPQEKTLHELFAIQARHHPDHAAVMGDNERLTYRQLDLRAAVLARQLAERGVGPDRMVGICMVGICMEKSADYVVAVMGILKAGGAYLPIDPDLPPDRIDFMIKDADVQVILTRKPFERRFDGFRDAGSFDKNPDIHILYMEILTWDSASSNTMQPVSDPDRLAYMIYTSGSTGTPKGVLITHRNVVRLIVNDRFDFDVTDQDVWTLFHAFSFDFSVWEMFGPLLHGGCIVLVPRLTAQDPRQFLALLKTNRVTVLNQTPTAFYALIPHIVTDAAHGGTPLPLRYVIFGGEALTPSLLKPFRNIYPQVALINMYGITETTVHVTYKALSDADIQVDSRTIGRPLPDLRVHILDRHLEPVPPGVWGEICVAGNGLARGYLNRPELTAEKFTMLPWMPDERIYRSGDLGRHRSDGELEYLGRADDQVKIRGYRIETREVVHHLLAHPEIRQAVVLAHTEADGSRSLRAYLAADHPLKSAGIRHHLQARLPEYMMPQLFQVPGIPMTVNGKVDAARLSAMTLSEIVPEDPFQPPRNDMEVQMAAVWQAVLGRERIGIHDNFFELGGHSLKAAQVVFRLQQVLEKEITLRDFFSAPTISGLAEVLQARGSSRLPDIVPAPPAADYEMSYPQRRLWVVDQVAGDSPAYHMSGAYLLTGSLNKSALEGMFQALVDRHESLRTVFVTVDAEPRQRILDSLKITVEEMELRESIQPEKDAYAWYLAETARPFDLKNGPLMRVQLLRMPDIGTLPRHILVINLHHIITDGWSVQVMIHEMSAIYTALCRGERPPLPPLALQYKDYAHWQHASMASPAMAAHREYWLERLASPLPELNLPLDFQRPQIQSHRSGMLRFTLPPELVQELDRLEQSGRVTRFMILAAGVTLLLHAHSRNTDICIGTPVAGRIHPDLEAQIGFYLNILVLRSRLNPDNRLSQVLEDMVKTVTDALDHQAYPFDLLVEELKIKRDPARHPVFDVLIIVQNNEPARLNWEGVEVSPFADESIASQFDLKFTVTPGAGWDIVVEYNPDLFREETVQRMKHDLQRILELLACSTQMSVDGLIKALHPEAFAEEAEFLKSVMSTDEEF